MITKVIFGNPYPTEAVMQPVEQAAQLLVSTEQPITAIGLSCGFWESSYFTKVFKKYKGITPKKYRQAARE